MKIRAFVSLLYALVLISQSLFAQEKSNWNKFNSLSRPEKIWVLTHPFIAVKSYELSNLTIDVVKQVKLENTIGQDETGGQLDAFRHAFWMALLSQKIKPGKVRLLGKAHEKGNYLGFKKRKLEDGVCADKASCEMDLWNNEIGIEIGITNKSMPINELKTVVIQKIKSGDLKVIKKDGSGNCLDKLNSIIVADKLCETWENEKCLVKSDSVP